MTRLKVGIIGCGAIAQIQYLPLLREAPERFAIAGLSDLSPRVLAALGDEYAVPPDCRFTNYHDLLATDIDAVIVCNSGSHAPPTIAAARADKHVLVEKPMATVVAEAESMVAAAAESGTTLMVGYMKRHDPAYAHAARQVQAMTDIRFVQVNHLHPDNGIHLAKFRLHRADDLDPEVREEGQRENDRLVAIALGYPDLASIPAEMRLAFFWVLNSMIHDLGNLSGLFGPPERVLATEIWLGGNAIATTLQYAAGFRAVATWVDLPDLPTFTETLEVYGGRERVLVSFPTGFSVGHPTTVVEHGMDADGVPWRRERTWHERQFALELDHFRDCILTGSRPLTDGRDAVADIALARDIILAHGRTNADAV